MPAEHPHPRAPRNAAARAAAPIAAIARCIPMEIADAMLEAGGGMTLEEMCVATGRTAEEVTKHAPEARRLAKARATRAH